MFKFLGSLPESNVGFGKLSTVDWMKILRLAVIASLGVFLTSIAESLANLDLGTVGDLIGILLTEIIRRTATPLPK